MKKVVLFFVACLGLLAFSGSSWIEAGIRGGRGIDSTHVTDLGLDTLDMDTVGLNAFVLARGGGTSDSIGVDADGNGTVDSYLYPSYIKKGANITLSVAGDTLTITGEAGDSVFVGLVVTAGNADTVWIDTSGITSNAAYIIASGDSLVFAVGDIDKLMFGTTQITLPVADGTNNQVMITNGSGTLSWATQSGVSTYVDSADYAAKLNDDFTSPADSIYISGDSVISNAGTTVLGPAGGTGLVDTDSLEVENVLISEDDINDFAGAGLEVASNALRVDLDYTFNWTNQHSFTYAVDIDTLIMNGDTLLVDHLIAHIVRMKVHNNTGATIPIGVPVCIDPGAGVIPYIDSARADNAASMPACGLTEHSIDHGDDGFVVVFGKAANLDTSPWDVKDELYVGPTGGLTTTKPTGTNLIQKIGVVYRDNPSQGDIYVLGAQRTNDIPNIAEANFWVGNASGVATAVTMSSDATMVADGTVTVVDDLHDHTATSLTLNLDEVGNPSADKTFSMANKDLKFVWTVGGEYDGALELEAAGAYSNEDLVHIHQHTGNAGEIDLLHIEAEDDDVVGLIVQVSANADTNSSFEKGEVFIDRADIDTIETGGDIIVEFAGNALTVASNVLNFDGGATPAGDLGGTWANPSVDDDSHNHVYSNIDETTSSNWTSRVSDETGSGAWVFNTAPTFVTSITMGSAELNEAELEILDGATLTTTELNYVDGVTSAIQTQITANADDIDDLETDTRYLVSIAIPSGLWVADSLLILVDPRTEAAITITRIEVSCLSDPSTELDFDLMWADAYIGNANRTVIDEMNTTNGAVSITAGFDDPDIAANKCIYIRFNAEPDADIVNVGTRVTYTID